MEPALPGRLAPSALAPSALAPSALAAVLAVLAVLVGACAPNTTPITRKGYRGSPVTGTPITFAPQEELDVDGDGAGDGWWWIPFDGSTGPEEVARCAGGGTTGLAIDPGTSGDLLVFFDGGGACWSYETCIAATARDRTFGLEKFLVEARDFIPCSVTSRALLPPSLAGATIVFVPYCTGDVHGGDHLQEYGNVLFNETWHHAGHANVLAYLRRLKATWPDPGKVVVAGSSAGGFGALLNYEAFRWYWPDAEGFLVDDSGPALLGDDVPPAFRDAWYNAWHLGLATDPFCLGCRDDLSSAFTELSDLHRQDRLALLSHAEDGVMGPFMLFPTGAGFAGALDRLEAGVLRPTGRARAFIEPGSDHMLLTPAEACGPGSYVASHAVGGATLADWLEAMISGSPAWDTVRP